VKKLESGKEKSQGSTHTLTLQSGASKKCVKMVIGRVKQMPTCPKRHPLQRIRQLFQLPYDHFTLFFACPSVGKVGVLISDNGEREGEREREREREEDEKQDRKGRDRREVKIRTR